MLSLFEFVVIAFCKQVKGNLNERKAFFQEQLRQLPRDLVLHWQRTLVPPDLDDRVLLGRAVFIEKFRFAQLDGDPILRALDQAGNDLDHFRGKLLRLLGGNALDDELWHIR